jgi:hypothetical protein
VVTTDALHITYNALGVTSLPADLMCQWLRM